jgi:uncharacterized protein
MHLDRFLNVFTPKYYSLFPYLENNAGNLISAAERLKVLMVTADIQNQDKIIRQINELENIGNNITYDTFDLLNSLFIIPFDREDINELVNKIYNVLDSINGISRMLHFYRLKELFPVFQDLADVIHLTSVEIGECIKSIRDTRGGKNKIINRCNNMNHLVKKADEIFYCGIFDIFSPEADLATLTKNKEVFELFKSCIEETKAVEKVFSRSLKNLV